MRKIAIFTILDSNFGNRLQNYAMQTVLKDYGDVKTLQYKRIILYDKKSVFFEIRYKFILNCKLFIKRLICGRDYNYHKFDKFIDYGKDLSVNSAEKVAEYYDFFVVGSDQIWNPEFNFSPEYNLLGFCGVNKRIAVAPSIANLDLAEKCADIYKKYLTEFRYLSCRESQGAEFIEKLTGKECADLIDPTLMLSDETWDRMARRPKWHKSKNKYMLVYFLGGKTDGHARFFDAVKTRYNLDIIDLYDRDSKYYTCGPCEFIWLIKNCSLMLTDSFHGSIFSYIYNRPFKILRREGKEANMNSRLTDLMDKLNLPQNTYIDLEYDIGDILQVNYDKSVLYLQQKRFKNYLDKVFNK